MPYIYGIYVCHILYEGLFVLDSDICLKLFICVLFILRFTFLEDVSDDEP